MPVVSGNGGALNKLFAKCINFALLAAIIPNSG